MLKRNRKEGMLSILPTGSDRLLQSLHQKKNRMNACDKLECVLVGLSSACACRDVEEMSMEIESECTICRKDLRNTAKWGQRWKKPGYQSFTIPGDDLIL